MTTERTLEFDLKITTTLGEGDTVPPTIEYVTDWLANNGYDGTWNGLFRLTPYPETQEELDRIGEVTTVTERTDDGR